MTERQSKIDRDAVLRLFIELRDHIGKRVHRQHEMDDTLYSFVLFRLFGYSFNTYKAIGHLLPDGFYEQAFALYRMLWEAGIGLEWISRDPEVRSHQYAGFTVVEYQRFLRRRPQIGVSLKEDEESIRMHEERLKFFHQFMAKQLERFSSEDKKGKTRQWGRFFGNKNVEELSKEIGGEWAEDYELEYASSSGYAHAAPGAVLFPIHDPDASIARQQDVERSAMVGVKSIAVMIRTFDRWATYQGSNEREYLAGVLDRLAETGTGD